MSAALTYAQGIGGPVLADLTVDPYGWMDWAACSEVDPSIFFPEKGGSTREAKKVCAGCEVREQCLEYALEHHDTGRFGVWGGLSERERDRLTGHRPTHSPTLTAVEPPTEGEKTCTGPCGQPKPLTAFNVDRGASDGRKQRCKACTAEQCQQSRQRRAVAV